MRRSGKSSRSGARRKHGARWLQWLPSSRTRKRLWRGFRKTPAFVQLGIAVALVATISLAVNWTYQVARKPSELLFPVSGTLYKTPTETWLTYGPLFRRHATNVMTPTFLAALAQVEASGNPLARTYWRWSMTKQPFEIYRPASSAVGMYQMTDGTFAEARRYCIRDHVAIEQGPWHDLRSCWFNGLYSRVIPSHAVELTSAYLDRHVGAALGQAGIESATLHEKQMLAAVIHLCGAGAGELYVGDALRPAPGQHCGAHDVRAYLAKVNSMHDLFVHIAQ
ncbi:MAG TPA: lytic transglycosylase domain-containing protein [Gammaproteobacteria bacterium]